MKYFDALTAAMTKLATHSRIIFLGQAIDCPGVMMYNTVKQIDSSKKIEMPVAENMQLGMSIGLSLNGFLPISIFPRWNFLLSATDQLVNHLDKLSMFSREEYNPKVIIRVGVGSQKPLFPGEQHIYDYSDMFEKTLKTVVLKKLLTAEQIIEEYDKAVERSTSTILVEYMDKYNE